MTNAFELLAHKLEPIAAAADSAPRRDARYPKYDLERGESVEWLPQPLVFSTLDGGEKLLCLGMSDQLAEPALEALVVALADKPIQQQIPVLLGRLLKFAPGDLVLDKEAWQRIKGQFGIA